VWTGREGKEREGKEREGKEREGKESEGKHRWLGVGPSEQAFGKNLWGR